MKGSTLPLLVAVGSLMTGCLTAEDAFVDGRREQLCTSAYPVCSAVAGCEITRGTFVVAPFPGVQQLLFRSGKADALVKVAVFFRDRSYPGSEVLVRLHEADCGNYDEAKTFSDDPFEEAGKDRILEFELESGGEGTHLLEVYSDATATGLVRAELVEAEE